jgi:hypothetical protein
MVSTEKSASGRLSFLEGRLAFGFVAAVAIPAIVAFCWHSVVATLGDDSVSYITLARHFSPWRPDPLAAPWAAYFANFPPLFPLLLALTGGAHDLFVGHMVVAAGAVASLFLAHAYAREQGNEAGALAVTVLFLLLPGMWLALAGILSESMFLALSLGALLYDARRVRPESPARIHAILGLWIAAALLTRTAAIALVAAYLARLALRAARDRQWPAARQWLPAVIPVATQVAWLLLRPAIAVSAYQEVLGELAGAWLQQPVATFAESCQFLWRGWIGVFAVESGGARAALLAGVVALAGLAGAAQAALRDRLDGWYVLAGVATVFLVRYNEDNSRRLLYPLLPLLLLHAVEAVRALAGRLPSRAGRWLPAATFALAAAAVLPATAMIARKALEREPYFPGLAYSPASMKGYYGFVDERFARAYALRDASLLGGMSFLDQWTPPDSRVMWVRPEYVAVLGRREGVALLLRWDRATLARQVQRTRTDFVVLSVNFKNDLAADSANAYLWLARDLPDYLLALAMLPDPAQADFVLLQVDADRLQRYIRQTEGNPPGPPGPSR